jgi:ribosomal protein S18 acetylase RimI-like enzyme
LSKSNCADLDLKYMSIERAGGFSIDTYQNGDEAAIIELWQQCGLVVPWNNPQTDIARKVTNSPELFFTGRIGGRLVASCMAGYDGHRGWIYFLAVANSEQRKGLAAQLVAHVEAQLIELGCPKLELMVRDTNREVIAFYEAIGFNLDPVRVLSKRLRQDDPHDFT